MMLLLEAETLQACESESSEYSIQSYKGDKTVTSNSDKLGYCKKTTELGFVLSSCRDN